MFMSDGKRNVARIPVAVARAVMVAGFTLLNIAGAVAIVGNVMNWTANEQERAGNVSQSTLTRQIGALFANPVETQQQLELVRNTRWSMVDPHTPAAECATWSVAADRVLEHGEARHLFYYEILDTSARCNLKLGLKTLAYQQMTALALHQVQSGFLDPRFKATSYAIVLVTEAQTADIYHRSDVAAALLRAALTQDPSMRKAYSKPRSPYYRRLGKYVGHEAALI